jgi:hypothetical protein
MSTGPAPAAKTTGAPGLSAYESSLEESNLVVTTRDVVIRCPGCGMSVALGTKTVQDAADEAERAWLAEQEQKGGSTS